jgi:hypothetical protein
LRIVIELLVLEVGLDDVQCFLVELVLVHELGRDGTETLPGPREAEFGFKVVDELDYR